MGNIKQKILQKKFNFLIIIILFTFLNSACSLFIERPSVLYISIHDGQIITDIDNFNIIEITFSESMNLYISERNIHLNFYNGSSTFQWDAEKKRCTLILKDKLEWGKKYVLKIETGCENSDGVNLDKLYSYTLFTYNPSSDFFIVNTSPANGQILNSNHNQQISINFSDIVEEQSIMDKISINPQVAFSYTFSLDRYTLYINFNNDLSLFTTYTIKIKKDIRSNKNKTLKEDYSFSFSTLQNNSSFNLNNAIMKNNQTEINLDIHYQAENNGLEKDMQLNLDFTHDIYEKNFSSNFVIEPTAFYTISKEKNGDLFRFKISFTNKLKSETRYKIIIKKGLMDIFNNLIDQEYKFYIKTDGINSIKPLITLAQNELNNIISNNLAEIDIVPLTAESLNPKIIFSFKIIFNHGIDVFKSLDKIKLTYSAGYAIGTIEYDSFIWDEQNSTLIIKFAIDPPGVNGVTTYFSFTIEGGEDGIVDRNSNTLDKTITAQLSFSF